MHMHPLIRNTLAVIAGLIVGGSLNMAVIILGAALLPRHPVWM